MTAIAAGASGSPPGPERPAIELDLTAHELLRQRGKVFELIAQDPLRFAGEISVVLEIDTREPELGEFRIDDRMSDPAHEAALDPAQRAAPPRSAPPRARPPGCRASRRA